MKSESDRIHTLRLLAPASARKLLALGMVIAGLLLLDPSARTADTPGAKGSAPGHQGDAAPHWSYEGETGPDHWGSLAPEFAACRTGQLQSPVDISRIYTAYEPQIEFHYQTVPLHAVNNGHTIQVNADQGGSITLESGSYALVQFHFHTPSEHTVQGQSYPMELHLVHRDAEGKLAVVGVFMREGRANADLQALWEHLPASGQEQQVQGALLDPAKLIPATASYYQYGGSLTTPPCTEGVRWHVLATPIEMSAQQIAALRALFPHNARPVQVQNQRVVIRVTHK